MACLYADCLKELGRQRQAEETARAGLSGGAAQFASDRTTSGHVIVRDCRAHAMNRIAIHRYWSGSGPLPPR